MVVQESWADLRVAALRCELGLATMRFAVVHPVVRGDMLKCLGVGRMWKAMGFDDNEDSEESKGQEIGDASRRPATPSWAPQGLRRLGSCPRLLMKDAYSTSATSTGASGCRTGASRPMSASRLLSAS